MTSRSRSGPIQSLPALHCAYGAVSPRRLDLTLPASVTALLDY